MKDLLERAFLRIKNEDLEEKNWEKDIYELELKIQEFLKSKKYEYKESISILKSATNETISGLNKNRSDSELHPERYLIEAVAEYKRSFQEFLDHYYLGFLKEFYLKKSGLIYVEIACLIRPKFSFHSEKETEKRKYAQQIQRLKDYGFILEKRNGTGNYSIIYEQNVLKLLKTLFSDFNVKGKFTIQLMNNRIDRISFYLKPENIITEDKKQEANSIPVEEELKNKIRFLDDCFKHLMHAMSTMKEDASLVETCGTLVEYYFSDICNTLNIETETSTIVNQRHQNNKILNQNAKEIKKDIGKNVIKQNTPNLIEHLFREINYLVIKNTGFCMDEANSYIGEYQYHLTFNKMDLNDSYHIWNILQIDDDEITETEIADIFQEIANKYSLIKNSHCESYLSYTPNNINKLSDWINQSHIGEIESINLKRTSGTNIIESFTVVGEYFPELASRKEK